MALNRYSSLPKQNLINSQVMPDINVIGSALERQQKNYDTTATAITQAQQGANALTGYGEKANEYLGKVKQDMNNFVGTIANQDLGSPEVRNKFSGYVQAVSSDPQLKAIQQANKLRADYESTSADLASKNKLHDSQQYFKDKAWEVYSKTGKLPAYASQPLSEYVDPYTETMKYFKDLEASGGDAIQHLADGTAFKNSSTGISGSRISDQAKGIFDVFKNDAIGRQYQLDYHKLVDQKLIDPTKTNLDQYLAKQLTSVGNTKIHSRTSTNRDAAENRMQDRAEKKAKEEATILTGTEAFANPIVGSNNKFNPDGSQRTTSTPASWLFGSIFGNQELTEEDLKDPRKKVIRLGAKAQGITEEEYANKYAKSLNIPVMNYVQEKPRTNLTTLVSKNGAGLINSAPIIDASGTTVGTLRDVLISQGVEDNPEALEKATKALQVTGKVVPSPIAADGVRISMNGQDYIMDMTPSIEMKGDKATAEEKKRYAEHIEHKFKAGYAEEIQAKDENDKAQTYIKYWNENLDNGKGKPKGGLDYKLSN